MYDAIDTAKILRNCITSEEVMKVGEVFGFLRVEMDAFTMNYVRVFCHARLRQVMK
jgi:hypothetical protein